MKLTSIIANKFTKKLSTKKQQVARQTFGPIGDDPLLKHIDGGGRWVAERPNIGTIIQPELYVHQILLRHLSPSSFWLSTFHLSTDWLLPRGNVALWHSGTSEARPFSFRVADDQPKQFWDSSSSCISFFYGGWRLVLLVGGELLKKKKCCQSWLRRRSRSKDR